MAIVCSRGKDPESLPGRDESQYHSFVPTIVTRELRLPSDCRSTRLWCGDPGCISLGSFEFKPLFVWDPPPLWVLIQFSLEVSDHTP